MYIDFETVAYISLIIHWAFPVLIALSFFASSLVVFFNFAMGLGHFRGYKDGLKAAEKIHNEFLEKFRKECDKHGS